MSNLINKTTAQIKAEKIDALQSELQSHVESILSLIYAEANTEGEQQAIMDVFGTGATAALTKYYKFLFISIMLLDNHSKTWPSSLYYLFNSFWDGMQRF